MNKPKSAKVEPITYKCDPQEAKSIRAIAKQRNLNPDKVLAAFVKFALLTYKTSAKKLAKITSEQLHSSDWRATDTEHTSFSKAAPRQFIGEVEIEHVG